MWDLRCCNSFSLWLDTSDRSHTLSLLNRQKQVIIVRFQLIYALHRKLFTTSDIVHFLGFLDHPLQAFCFVYYVMRPGAPGKVQIHGARAVLLRVKYDTGGFRQWVSRLAQRAPRNKVVVAIANKLACIARAVLSSGKDYRHQPLQTAAA